jgi:site-specific DNA recombinase
MMNNTASPPYPAATPGLGFLADLEQSLVPKRAVSYIRVSTREQAERGGREEGFSIPAQREANKRKSQSLGAMVVKEFVDRGETGTNTNRRGLKDMLTYLDVTPDIDYVIVHKLDRLARSRAGDVDITRALDAAGVRLISTTENIDQTPGGLLMHGIMSSIAEFYSNNLAAEVTKGMTQKAQTGGTPGAAPLGYLNRRGIDERGREYRTIALDPDRAPLVRQAFELYATGEWTLHSLAGHLNAYGLTTRATPMRPATPVNEKILNRLLLLPYYRGIVRYLGVEYPGTHEPLVDVETWLKVQSVLAGHRNGERTRKHPHYLKSTLICARCGSRMLVHNAKAKSGEIYPYFVCLGRKARTSICDLKAVLIDVIEDKVADLYRTISLTPEDRQRIEAWVLEEIASTSRDTLDRRKALNGERDRLARERQQLLQAHYADAIPVDLLKTEQDRITRTLADIDREQHALAADESTAKANLTGILDMLENCDQTYRRLPEHLKRLMNLAFFEHILVALDEHLQPRTIGQLVEPLLTLTASFRALAANAEAAETETSPVQTDETRISSCSIHRRKPNDHVRGLHTGYVVDPRRFELLTSSMRTRRATNCAKGP